MLSDSHLHVVSGKSSSHREMGRRVAWALGRGKWELLVHGDRVQCCTMKSSGNWLHSSVDVLNTTRSVHFEVVNMVHFMFILL